MNLAYFGPFHWKMNVKILYISPKKINPVDNIMTLM